MSDNSILIWAEDCSPFEKEVEFGLLKTFVDSEFSLFGLNTKRSEDGMDLATYDFKSDSWRAGRFIGEMNVFYSNQVYRIIIKPRFGEAFLFRMFENIFNIKITKSLVQYSDLNQRVPYIKRLVNLIWIHKLGNANRHGMPSIKKDFFHYGRVLKGRIDVNKTIRRYYCFDEVVSIERKKVVDNFILQIIFKAYQILRLDYNLNEEVIPDSVKESINFILNNTRQNTRISSADYDNIRYQDVFLSWKPVVDFSWEIIQNRNVHLEQKDSKNGFGLFIDMAEVWELYLKSLLNSNLKPLGWENLETDHIAYNGLFFRRKLIPDFVFKKGNQIVVWDAKYKLMSGDFRDVDREDFFQIHTYIQYFNHPNRVKSGGLLYPLISKVIDFDKYYSPFLMNDDGARINFIIDGIEMNIDFKDDYDYELFEQKFIKRIIKYLS